MKKTYLTADNIAETVFWTFSLPANVNINVLEVMPTGQSFALGFTKTGWKMNIINSYSDWGRLEEIILGSPKNLTLPDLDISSRNFFDLQEDFAQQKSNTNYRTRKSEMEEDFQELTSILEGYGVKVRRPEAINLDVVCQTPHWASQQSHALMPRDCMLVLGDTLIEVPMPSRNRYFESQSFRNITREYFQKVKNGSQPQNQF